jgi:hypothetical protein
MSTMDHLTKTVLQETHSRTAGDLGEITGVIRQAKSYPGAPFSNRTFYSFRDRVHCVLSFSKLKNKQP